MELLEGLNAAIDYIEAHLQDGIDLTHAAKYVTSSVDGFSRLFSNLTGITIKSLSAHFLLYQIYGGKGYGFQIDNNRANYAKRN